MRAKRTAVRIRTKTRAAIHAIRKKLGLEYQPEKHYMRGPGPACAKLGASMAVK